MWRVSARSLIVSTALGIASTLCLWYWRRRRERSNLEITADETSASPLRTFVVGQAASEGRLNDGNDNEMNDQRDNIEDGDDESEGPGFVVNSLEQTVGIARDAIDARSMSASGAEAPNSSRNALVVEDAITCNFLMNLLLKGIQAASDKVVGIDCEWVTDGTAKTRRQRRRRRVSLLQLATDDVCLLLRLHKLSDDNQSLPACLQALLADESVLKVGVAVLEDAAKLKEDYNVVVASCVDLRHLAGSYAQDWSQLGLKGLCSAILGATLGKSSTVRCGDWEADTLSEQQVHCASQDPFVALDIYRRLTILIKEKSAAAAAAITVESECTASAISETQFAATSNDTGDIARREPTVHVPGVSNSPHKQVPALAEQLSAPNATDSAVTASVPKQNDRRMESVGAIAAAEKQLQCDENEKDAAPCSERPTAEPSSIMKQSSSSGNGSSNINSSCETTVRPSSSASTKYPPYSVRKRPLYDNCLMQAPDGKALSTCNTKKARWYLNKGLAVLVAEEPLTIRLLHEPRGCLDENQLRYYTAPKQNLCVVCGDPSSYVRKNIVPREYRRHFPASMKDHSSHDILLLCAACHQRCDAFDSEFKLQLASTYNAPIRKSQQQGISSIDEARRDATKVASVARALLKAGDRIPSDRRTEYERLIRAHLGLSDNETAPLSDTALRELSLGSSFRSSMSMTSVAASGDETATAAVDANVAAKGSAVCAGSRDDSERHGYKVVQQVLAHGGLIAFERQWRQRFVTLMAPRHLPPFWSIDYCHVTESVSGGKGNAEHPCRGVVERTASGDGDAPADIVSPPTAEHSC